MTEVERWLKTYGKATAKTKQENTRSNTNKKSDYFANATITKDGKVRVGASKSKEQLNREIREILNDMPLHYETFEEKMQRRMNNVEPEYHPGIHTQNFSAPTGSVHLRLNCEMQNIMHYGGEIIDIKTTASFMFTNVILIYKMPDWDVILEKMYGRC